MSNWQRPIRSIIPLSVIIALMWLSWIDRDERNRREWEKGKDQTHWIIIIIIVDNSVALTAFSTLQSIRRFISFYSFSVLSLFLIHFDFVFNGIVLLLVLLKCAQKHHTIKCLWSNKILKKKKESNLFFSRRELFQLIFLLLQMGNELTVLLFVALWKSNVIKMFETEIYSLCTILKPISSSWERNQLKYFRDNKY